MSSILKKLEGKKILLTSGPTRGPIDAVRYITNKSTGKLGALIAEETLLNGGDVTFIYGKDSQLPDHTKLGSRAFSRLTTVEVETVDDLLGVVKREVGSRSYDAMIHAMAVLDYVPGNFRNEKTPSGMDRLTINLVKTPKIIGMIKNLDPNILLIGFKLEYDKTKGELIRVASESLMRNSANLVVANDLKKIERGKHTVYVINPQGKIEGTFNGKENIARGLIGILA